MVLPSGEGRGRELGGVGGAGSTRRSSPRSTYAVVAITATTAAATATLVVTRARWTRRRAISRNASNGGGTIWSPRRRSRASSDMAKPLSVVPGVVQQAGEPVACARQPRLHRALRDPELSGDLRDR